MKKKENRKKIVKASITFGISVCVLGAGAYAWWAVSNNAVTGGNFKVSTLDLTATLYHWKVDTTSSWVVPSGEDKGKISVTDMIPGDSSFYAIEVKNSGIMTGRPYITVSGNMIDYKYIQGSGFVPHTTNGTIPRVSKMIILNITTSVALTTPTPQDITGVETGTGTAALTDSLYEKTHKMVDSTETVVDYNYGLTDDDEKVTLAKDASIFYIMEFYFSGVAGNEYQNTQLALSTISVSMEQDKGSKVI